MDGQSPGIGSANRDFPCRGNLRKLLILKRGSPDSACGSFPVANLTVALLPDIGCAAFHYPSRMDSPSATFGPSGNNGTIGGSSRMFHPVDRLSQPGGCAMKTDSQLQKDVMDEIKWEPSATASEIGVSVSKGVVTLNGTVATYAEKWAVERAAQRVEGVKGIA